LVLCRYSKYPKSKTPVAKAIIKAPKPADPTNWLEDREVPELVMVEVEVEVVKVGFGAGNTHTTTLTMFVILFAMVKMLLMQYYPLGGGNTINPLRSIVPA
jgi:hypothetical protein